MVPSVTRMRAAMSRPSALPSPSPAARRAWLWCLAVLLVLKAAVPLLAAAAADRQGVTLAQVCTVYGVRTAASMAAEDAAVDSQGDTLPSHGSAEHCALASLAGGPLPDAVPAVLAHAPPQPTAAVPERAGPLPADAALRWLSARLHAPPWSA